VSAPLAGGNVTTLFSAQSSPDSIAMDSAHLYWANTYAAAVMAGSKDGGGAVMLAPIDVDPETPIVIAVDAVSVYWTTNNVGTVMKAPLVGGSATTLYSKVNSQPEGIAVDDSSVYFADNIGGTVFKLSPK
jgi:sugar lactone lactonase YvrE